MIALCAKAKDAFACPPFISPRGWSFRMSSSSGWPTASSRTNGAIDGESDLEEERRLFWVATTRAERVPFILFSRCSPTKRTPGPPHAKSLSQGTARVAVRHCTTPTHPIGNDRPGGTISDAKAEGTEDRSKGLAPKAKPAKQAGHSHVSRGNRTIDSYTTKSPGKETSLPFSRNSITDLAKPRASSTGMPFTAQPIKDEHAIANAEPSTLA